MNKLLLLLTLLNSTQNLSSQTHSATLNLKKIIKFSENIFVKIEVDTNYIGDTISFYISPVETTPGYKSTVIKKNCKEGLVNLDFTSENSVWISTPDLLKKINFYWLAEAGDSITIKQTVDNLSFSGKGAEKLKIWYEIMKFRMKAKKPSNPHQWSATSIEDYLEWNSYLNNQLRILIPLLDSYKNKFSDLAYKHIKFEIIGRVEEDRLDKFTALRWQADNLGISNKDLSNIFDTTFYGSYAMWMRSISLYHSSWFAFTRTEVYRKYNFNNDFDSLQSQAKRLFLYYNHGKKKFKGKVLEDFFLRLIPKEAIYEMGFTPETEKLLAMYYAEPGYLEYKNYVKEYESMQRLLKSGNDAPDFILTDINGRSFVKNDLKGKIVLMDFWFTGCIGCIQMTSILRKVEDHFKNDSNVIFLSISTDTDSSKWIKSIRQKKYTTGTAINLYTGSKGYDHEMLKKYSIKEYPSLFLLDTYGKIVKNPLPDPRIDNGDKLIGLIQHQLTLLKDGPYIFYNNDSVSIYSIYGSSVLARKSHKSEQCKLSVQGNELNKTFNLTLKETLKVEPSKFRQPQKLLALSDIEGNFDALYKLLHTNNVIDEHYNWTFGKGHLVFIGDMFDRGKQVTECLWLIYSLEDKAKKAGGYVHFILGNHEIMNLSGDFRYVKQKYKDNAFNMGKPYLELYDEDSELGRWLRKKNIVEKIGSILFVHGGISQEVNELHLTIPQINALSRSYYDKESIAKLSANKNLTILFNTEDKLSPFWYRSYYQDKKMKIMIGGTKGIDTVYKATLEQINLTLKKFNVKRIITGHTILVDTISIHFDGKVINTDTNHSTGKSEALLIEGDNYYRVTSNGDKFFLLSQHRKHSSTHTTHLTK